MPKLFTRKAADVAMNYADDAKLVKARARLAEVEALLKGAQSRVAGHDDAVSVAEADERRTQLEILAGRSSDAVLANKQAALLDARRRRAVDVLAAEDASSERDRLLADIPALELAAKRRAAAALRAKYLAAVVALRDSLAAVVEADAAVAALVEDAGRLFPGGRDNLGADGRPLPGLEPRAGCAEISRTHFNRQVNLLQWERPTSGINSWLTQVNEAIESVERRIREHDTAA